VKGYGNLIKPNLPSMIYQYVFTGGLTDACIVKSLFPPPFTALTVKFVGLWVIRGVPDTTPLTGSKTTPDGNVPELILYPVAFPPLLVGEIGVIGVP